MILYGKSSPGYIRSFQRKNTATSDQPLYILEIGWEDKGEPINKTIKMLADVEEVEQIEKRKIDILYLEKDPNIFAMNFSNL